MDELIDQIGHWLRVHDPVIVESVDGRIVSCNRAAEQCLQHARGDLLGLSLTSLVEPEFRGAVENARYRCAAGDPGPGMAWSLRRSDGRSLPVLVTQFALTDGAGTVRHVVTLCKEVGEYERRETWLREMLRTEERAERRERRALGREARDTVGRLLALTRIRLATLREFAADAALARRIEEVSGLVEDAERHARRLLSRLDPSLAGTAALETVLLQLVQSLQVRYELDVGTRIEPGVPRLDPDVQAIVCRSLRELLVNVRRHAATDRASLHVAGESDHLVATVQDDGRGFDPTRAHSGFGLISIRERLRAIGGMLTVQSNIGTGTRAILRAPASRRILR